MKRLPYPIPIECPKRPKEPKKPKEFLPPKTKTWIVEENMMLSRLINDIKVYGASIDECVFSLEYDMSNDIVEGTINFTPKTETIPDPTYSRKLDKYNSDMVIYNTLMTTYTTQRTLRDEYLALRDEIDKKNREIDALNTLAAAGHNIENINININIK